MTLPCRLLLSALAGHMALAQTCDTLPHADHPSARLSNGRLSAVLFLPDPNHGYYRGPRFDWSGLVACASLHGHTFFGEWFDRYDPHPQRRRHRSRRGVPPPHQRAWL